MEADGIQLGYLEDSEKEVATIMTSLFDEEQIMRTYVESERRQAAEAAADAAAEATVQRMLRFGKFSDEDIAFCAGVSEERVKEIKAEVSDK